MRKILFSLIWILMVPTSVTFAFSDELKEPVVEGLLSEDSPTQKHEMAIYQLFPTQNMWTFIKLNTRNGKMWQVQFDVKGENRFETLLSLIPLVSKEKEINGRFTLYPTQNMWTFILLDQLNGKMWQVQWSMELENRGIIPIK